MSEAQERGGRQLTVQLPADVAAELVEEGHAVTGELADHTRGGLADIAPYAALIAGNAAAVVTLLSTPDVLTSIARRLLRRGTGASTRWLTARGPGGEVSLRLTEPIDAEVLAVLLGALWGSDEDVPGAD